MEHNTTQMIHIGKIIETELHRQDRPVTWFANKLYCDRTNVITPTQKNIKKKRSFYILPLLETCN